MTDTRGTSLDEIHPGDWIEMRGPDGRAQFFGLIEDRGSNQPLKFYGGPFLAPLGEDAQRTYFRLAEPKFEPGNEVTLTYPIGRGSETKLIDGVVKGRIFIAGKPRYHVMDAESEYYSAVPEDDLAARVYNADVLRSYLISLGADPRLSTSQQARDIIEQLQLKVLAPTEMEQTLTTIIRQHGVAAHTMRLDSALETLLAKGCAHPPTRFMEEHKLHKILRDELFGTLPDVESSVKTFVAALKSLGLGVAPRDPSTAETLPPTWEDVKAGFREMGDRVSEALRDIAREAGK